MDSTRQYPAERYVSVDVCRGLIMIVMALDHAASAWAADRHQSEILLTGIPASYAFTGYADGWHQFTRVITHLCAPGFQFLAGVGLALSVGRSLQAGTSQWLISGDMVLRGLVLIAVEWTLMVPVYGFQPFLFLVLSAIGSSIILFSVMRFLPRLLIAVGSLAILVLQPLYGPTAPVAPTLEKFPIHIWNSIATAFVTEPLPWRVMYPILPWIGMFGVGWCVGSGMGRAGRQPRWVVPVGLMLLAAGIGLKWFGGTLGDRWPGGEAGPWFSNFWIMAKYPPSPAFSLVFLGGCILLLGVLAPLDRQAAVPLYWRLPNLFGRVALFFYVVHFYLYGLSWYLTVGPDRIAAHPPDKMNDLKFPLIVAYGVWLTGLMILWPLCWGYDRLRRRFRRILRYF
jgi:uncharacterized membrane protein